MESPPRFEIVEMHDTRIGTLCLRRRALASRPGTVVTEVTLDGILLMSSHHTRSERALASLALEFHGGSHLRVLVGGLGLGYTAREALRSGRVASVEVVEALDEVISWQRKGLIPLAGELASDPRLAIVRGDVFARLLDRSADAWDVVLVDVDHSPGEVLAESNRRFYAVSGLRRVRGHLAPGGVLATWSTAESGAFADALEGVFRETRVETVTWWNELVDEEKRDTLFLARR